MSHSKIFERYTIDTITLLKSLAKTAKAEADNPKEGFKDHAEGTIMGYYSIITLLKHEAFVFCIDQQELGLADIKPDVDLLGLGRNPDIDFVEDNWSIGEINEERIKNYLSDSITLLKAQMREAKKEADSQKNSFESYNKGEWMAYCSLFSLLRHQAAVFNINTKELGIDDTELERDLT